MLCAEANSHPSLAKPPTLEYLNQTVCFTDYELGRTCAYTYATLIEIIIVLCVCVCGCDLNYTLRA